MAKCASVYKYLLINILLFDKFCFTKAFRIFYMFFMQLYAKNMQILRKKCKLQIVGKKAGTRAKVFCFR